ncbi:MAG: redoxin domain-containing protein [Terrimicrobiaceae bacterium]
MILRTCAAMALVFLLGMGSLFANAAADWAAILALDAGPKRKPASKDEVILLARNHLLIQRKALESFLSTYPRDAKAPSAQLRLAGVLATEGNMDSNPRQIQEALKMLAGVEANPLAPNQLRADAGFRKASIVMQSASPSTPQGVKTIVAAARQFSGAYPTDLRAARLFVEAATVCDNTPALKRKLLEEAKQMTTEDSLQRRIADDLMRLDLLGKTFDLSLPALSGDTIQLAAHRGTVVLLIFWSSEAPQSLLWLRDFKTQWEKLGASAPKVVTVNLDSSRREAEERAAAFPSSWQVGYEPGGWQSATDRRLGINALPSVWVIDSRGILQSLNAKTDWTKWASSGLLNE